MKKLIYKIGLFSFVISSLSNCTTFNHSMREPNTRVNFNKSDFSLSDQVSAEATSVKVFGIDWARLFSQKTGDVQGVGTLKAISIPVIGNFISDKTAGYSLHELMSKNPGYDIVFYPQYETKVSKPILGIGLLTKITTVKTTARLGKMNK